MNILKTPKERFIGLPDYPFTENFVEVAKGIQMHFVDEGQNQNGLVLMLHGEPTWSYLYRKMIPIFVKAGYRVIAPDLIGFGKSDKFEDKEAYSYLNHINWLKLFAEKLDLQEIILVCQDWGGLLGIRLAAENEHRFSAIIAGNTFLPTGEMPVNEAFMKWQTFAITVPVFPIGNIVNGATNRQLSEDEIAAYDAPFPDESYKAAARIFPKLVPISADDPASEANKAAWKILMNWQKPFLTCFSDNDPITRGGDKVFQSIIPGAKGQPHITITDAGHFLQEDKGVEWANFICDFLQKIRTE